MRTRAATVLFAAFVTGLLAQPGEPTLVVPRLVRIANSFHPANGLPPAPVESVTLSVYREEYGGQPLWQETQNVRVDSEGHYTAMLGASLNAGVPLDLFRTGESRWLGVQFNRPGEGEQLRIQLVSVPYALKAVDAETLGGLPASAYLLDPNVAANETVRSGAAAPEFLPNPKSLRPRASTGSVNYIPYFSDIALDLGNSALYQSGGNVGIGTTIPGFKLDVQNTGIAINAQSNGMNAAYTVRNLSNIGWSAVDSYDYAGALRAGFGYGNPGAFNFAGNAYIYTNGIDFVIGASSANPAVMVKAGGNVGIGTRTPGAKMEVNGSLKISGVGNGIIFPDGTQQSTAAGSVGATGLNTQAIALLRWYGANLTTQFPTGAAPAGIAFDGSNMWVANAADNTVSKLQAPNGANLSTVAVGTNPHAIAFDGANVWVVNYSSNTVSKLRVSDGSTLGTFTVGTNPCGTAFDGTNLWVANYGSNTVTKLRAGDGVVLGTFTVGTNPCGIAFDGTNLWVANSSGNTVTKLRASDGSNQGTVYVGSAPRSVTFDGANLWVTNYGGNTVTRLRASDGTNQGTFNVGSYPAGSAFDGTYVWVANGGDNTVTKLRAYDGSNQGTFPVGLTPNSVAFDGVNIWVTNSSSNSVSKL